MDYRCLLRRTAVGLLALVLHLPNIVGAQATGEHPFDVFERPSRVTVAWPKDYMYEGQPTIPAYLSSHANYMKALRNLDVGTHSDCYVKWPLSMLPGHGNVEAYACTHTFTPCFVIRQMHVTSAAVKPPSFNPFYEWNTYRFSLDAPAYGDYRKVHGTLSYFRLKVAHHSNGQAGCTYFGERWVSKDSACKAQPPVNRARPNTVDGDFSTSFVETAYALGLFGVNLDYSIDHYLAIEVAALQHATYANILYLPGRMGADQKRTYSVNEITVRRAG